MYALYGLYRLWRALRMDEQLLRRFLHPRGEEVPVAGEIKADLRTVNHIVTQAIRQLRQLRVDMPGWRKIFEENAFCMSCRGSWWSAVPATAKPRPC